MSHLQAGIVAAFFSGFYRRLAGTKAVALGNKPSQLFVAFCQGGRQGVIGSDGAERGAKQRVGPGREYLQRIVPACDLEPNMSTLGPTDPIVLH